MTVVSSILVLTELVIESTKQLYQSVVIRSSGNVSVLAVFC